MLQSLTIKNIALIDNLTIDLSNGFNVLTGETGAGKSLIIDSLALLLGEKADKSLISYGENFASVEAVFYTELESVLLTLEEFGLERENTIVIYRKLSADGRNECRVNGKTFTLSMLKQITSPLMDLHGQFQHQEILKNRSQLQTLDAFGGVELAKAKNEYLEQFIKLKQIKKQLKGFNYNLSDRERLLDLYSYQINEIEEANFIEGEEESLKEYRIKVLNQEKICLAIERVLNLFSSDNYGYSIIDIIKKIDASFLDVTKYLPEYEGIANRISSVKYELEDIEDTVGTMKDNLYFDEFSAAENEKRLDLLSSLKKKYGANISEINNFLKNIKEEYAKLLNSAEEVERLEKEKESTINILKEKAKNLSLIRKNNAELFELRVKAELSELSMKSAKFNINFESVDVDFADESGFDKIEFMFTANAGQPLKPLNKVASGGEMSRLMLAVKNITADIDKVDTMIFDEIDTGISGDTANVLAEKLAKIGALHQVICVTHLAQVASFGTNHFYISKQETDGKTKTTLKNLDNQNRVKEIARIIGGEISSFSINHAELMLKAGENFNSIHKN